MDEQLKEYFIILQLNILVKATFSQGPNKCFFFVFFCCHAMQCIGWIMEEEYILRSHRIGVD